MYVCLSVCMYVCMYIWRLLDVYLIHNDSIYNCDCECIYVYNMYVYIYIYIHKHYIYIYTHTIYIYIYIHLHIRWYDNTTWLVDDMIPVSILGSGIHPAIIFCNVHQTPE